MTQFFCFNTVEGTRRVLDAFGKEKRFLVPPVHVAHPVVWRGEVAGVNEASLVERRQKRTFLVHLGKLEGSGHLLLLSQLRALELVLLLVVKVGRFDVAEADAQLGEVPLRGDLPLAHGVFVHACNLLIHVI